MEQDSDRSPLRDSSSLDEVLVHLAYPGELPVLADLARMFLALGGSMRPVKMGCRLTDAQALRDAVHTLLDAFEHLLGVEPVDYDRAILPWPHIVDLAYDTYVYADVDIELWREVLSLSDDDRWELLCAARAFRRRHA